MTDNLTLVRTAIAETISADLDEVTAEQTLFADLELESIDLLDVFFRIEQSSGVAMSADELGNFLQGGIADDVFSDESDVVTQVGLEQLERAIPGFSAADRSEPLKAEGILDLVTVGTLERAVSSRQTAAA